MLRRILIAAALAAPVVVPLAIPVAVRAQTEPPLAFLQRIYEPYRQQGFKGQPYWEAERFFVDDLAQAILRDFAAAKKRNEVPTLDGDPFIDAQDWSIPSFEYTTSKTGTGRAAAGIVTFVNLDQPKQLALFLVETPDGWRIDDIVGRGTSLRALYKLR